MAFETERSIYVKKNQEIVRISKPCGVQAISWIGCLGCPRKRPHPPLIEFKKSRHKHFSLLLAAAIVLNYFYLFHGISPDQQEWYNVLYGLPVINTLILSVLMAVIASQSVDMEHKGAMWNLLPTLESRASIYLGKLLYGFIYLTIFCSLQMAMVILMGVHLGFAGSIPFHAIGVTFLAELVSGMIVYQVQCLLSLLFSSQFAALSVGFGGTLTGLFLAYISTKAWTPWSVLFSLSPVGMDYDRASRTATLFLRPVTVPEILTALLYLVGFFLLGLYLFTKTEQGELLAGAHEHRVSHSVHSGLPVELIKLKRNPLWIPFVLIPLISAVIGTVNFTQNQDVLKNTWGDLWTQQSLFLGMFFLAPLVGILCSLLWRMEHQGSNWNLILTVTTPAKLVKDKWLTASLLSVLSIGWIAMIYLFKIRSDTNNNIFQQIIEPSMKEKFFYSINTTPAVNPAEVSIKCELYQNAIMNPKLTKLGDLFDLNIEDIHSKANLLPILSPNLLQIGTETDIPSKKQATIQPIY